MTFALLALLLASLPATPADVREDEPGIEQESPLPRVPPVVAPDEVDGGSHWRLETDRGAIHVWRPLGYRRSTAGTVVYFHGYYTDVDAAWAEHRLAGQFRNSGRNALFVVAESPQSNPDTVKWSDPSELFEQVRRKTGLEVPERHVVVVGHSGAFRTIVPWLAWPLLREVILLDGLYNNLPDFEAWLKGADETNARRLVLVGFETADRAEALVGRVADSVVREEVPERLAQVRREDRSTRLLFLRSQYGHMELVTEGRTLPILLKLGALRPL